MKSPFISWCIKFISFFFFLFSYNTLHGHAQKRLQIGKQSFPGWFTLTDLQLKHIDPKLYQLLKEIYQGLRIFKDLSNFPF